jgi:hypothetical protein
MGCICPIGRMTLAQNPKAFGQGERGQEAEGEEGEERRGRSKRRVEKEKPRVGRKRQVIGILVGCRLVLVLERRFVDNWMFERCYNLGL